METILFIDPVGFTIVAEKVKVDENEVVVKNPAVLQAAPNQQNQLQVQLLPVLFREFLAQDTRKEGVTFTYPKNRIVLSDAVLEERLVGQYESICGAPSAQNPGSSSNEVVKLFDE
jgi:hypothetical protein